MDITEIYVKMCEKASEIQYEYAVKGFGYSDGHHFFHLKNQYETIWLPRQDQLQEMVEDGEFANNQAWYKLGKFYAWVRDVGRYNFESMEQLWLAFVMKENGKTWDGEDWKSDKFVEVR